MSWLITKLCEPLEDTVVAARRADNEIKNVRFNTERDLPVTRDEIKIKALFYTRKKKQASIVENEGEK